MMRFVRCLIAAGAIAAAVGCDKSPTAPSNDGASLAASLSPANEEVPVTNSEFLGTGNVTVSFAITRDGAGTITSAAAAFQVTLLGFPPGTAVTLAHIRRGAAGTSGPVVVDTGLFPGELVLTTGTGSFTKAGISVAPDLVQEMLNSPAAFYFSVSSVLNASGMARGQLVK